MDVNPEGLASVRQLAGLSQAELARRSKVSQGHISDLESGTKKTVGPDTAKKLADAIGCPVGAFASVRISAKVATS